METFSTLLGICAGNSPVTGEFPAQRASDAENVSTLMTSHVCVSGLFLSLIYVLCLCLSVCLSLSLALPLSLCFLSPPPLPSLFTYVHDVCVSVYVCIYVNNEK